MSLISTAVTCVPHGLGVSRSSRARRARQPAYRTLSAPGTASGLSDRPFCSGGEQSVRMRPLLYRGAEPARGDQNMKGGTELNDDKIHAQIADLQAGLSHQSMVYNLGSLGGTFGLDQFFGTRPSQNIVSGSGSWACCPTALFYEIALLPGRRDFSQRCKVRYRVTALLEFVHTDRREDCHNG